MSLGNKYIKNSFFNVAGWLWLAVISFATIPYIVNKLGYDAYGVLTLVLMVLGYFAFLDFGLGEAVIKYIAQYHALKNFEKMNRILNSILFLFVIVGIVGAVGIVLFTEFFALRLFRIPLPLVEDTRFCFFLAAAGFSFNLILGVISKIPEAVQRFDISNRNSVITGTIVSVGNVALLALGYGLRAIVVMNLLVEILGIGLFYYASKQLIPELRVGLRFHYEDFKEVMHFGLYTIFTKFSGVIMNTVNQLVVGFVIGPVGVAIFNVPFRVITRFNGLIYRIAFVIFPVSSELHATDNMETLRASYLKLSKFVFLLSSILFLPVAAFATEILRYWMGADFASRGATVMLYCCLAFYFISFTMVPSLVVLGMGRAKFNAVFSSVTAAINIIFVYPFSITWGVDGAAGALLLSSLLFPLYIHSVNRNILKVSSWGYFKTTFGGMVFINLLFFILVKYFIAPFATSLLLFLAVLAFCYVVITALVYFLGLGRDDRRMIRDRVGFFTRRRGNGG